MKINGVEYKPVPVTFNLICELEDMGVSIANMESHILSTARAYAAVCMGKTLDEAGKIIEEHVINGGEIADIVNVLGDEVQKSGFFRKQGTPKTANAIPEA